MRKVVFDVLLVSSFTVPSVGKVAAAKAGFTCTKVKAIQVVGNKKLSCIKSVKKLVWDKGVTIPKNVMKKS